MLNKYYVLANNTVYAQQLFNRITSLYKKYIVHSILESNIIICIGGDGFLLEIMNKYYQYNIPIYPINGGTLGFLTNAFSDNDISENIKNSDSISIYPLELKINEKIYYAFNEITIFRSTPQATHFIFDINHQLKEEIKGDGLIISTPMGSTGYNYSAGGPILPLNSRLISIVPICPSKPKNWKGAILNNNCIFYISITDLTKRPAFISCDNREYGNVDSFEIKRSEKKLDLLIDNFKSFNLKIMKEQFFQ
jgi:NAD+ kinase